MKFFKQKEEPQQVKRDESWYVNENIKILDQIDFTPFIEANRKKKLSELVAQVQETYDDTPLTNNEITEGCVFNWLTEEEIVDYLEKRYVSLRVHSVLDRYID